MYLTERLRKLLKDRQPVKIAILGGGAGATEFIIRLMQAGGGAIPFDITVYEPREKLGRGIAWENNTDSLIANMRLETLGPTYPDFTLIKDILADMGHSEAIKEYPSRNAMGAALDYRWREAVGRMPTHWRWRHVRAIARELSWDGAMASVSQDSGEPSRFDLVVLALGNVPAKRDPELPADLEVISGWDERAIGLVPNDADVLVRGASLTSIDVTIRLLENGHRSKSGNIVWHSRSGELPFVRPRQASLDPAFLNLANLSGIIEGKKRHGKQLTLADLEILFKAELGKQAGAGGFASNTDFVGLKAMFEKLCGPGEGLKFLRYGIENCGNFSLWFSGAKLLDEYLIPYVWNALAEDERAVFLRRYRRLFDRLWAPIPEPNAILVEKWLLDSTVQLLRNGTRYVAHPTRPGKISFEASVEDPLEKRTRGEIKSRYGGGFDVLVEAGGIAGDMNTLDSPLVASMCAQGLLVPLIIPVGAAPSAAPPPQSLGAQIDWYSGAVLDHSGQPHGWLFTLTGSLTTGAHRFTNSYLAVSASGDRVATTILAPLD